MRYNLDQTKQRKARFWQHAFFLAGFFFSLLLDRTLTANAIALALHRD
jgi:hypothetical protein